MTLADQPVEIPDSRIPSLASRMRFPGARKEIPGERTDGTEEQTASPESGILRPEPQIRMNYAGSYLLPARMTSRRSEGAVTSGGRPGAHTNSPSNPTGTGTP